MLWCKLRRSSQFWLLTLALRGEAAKLRVRVRAGSGSWQFFSSGPGPGPGPQKTDPLQVWSEAYTCQMAISQPVFDSLICAETKYEQLQRTKLHKITWNQVSTKSFTKVQKTLILGKYSSDFNKPKVFRFPNLCWNKVWASLANRTPSWQVKLSIHEILHQLFKDWTETLLSRDHQSQMLHTNIYNHSLL